ncbi:hypothetical protein [Paraburkholderia sp. GAS206C]|uniref:hypothetical protein n=1 Tax=unclassified Paraburkholderia TaxID=2615204 RepID=UPI003D1AB5AE
MLGIIVASDLAGFAVHIGRLDAAGFQEANGLCHGRIRAPQKLTACHETAEFVSGHHLASGFSLHSPVRS